MSSSNLTNYILVAAVLSFFGWRQWKAFKMKPLINEYLDQDALIVDVRTPNEYKAGHNEGSMNIPLNVLEARMHELDRKRRIVLCCASGARSNMALRILMNGGFENVINAGAWTNAVKTGNTVKA